MKVYKFKRKINGKYIICSKETRENMEQTEFYVTSFYRKEDADRFISEAKKSGCCIRKPLDAGAYDAERTILGDPYPSDFQIFNHLIRDHGIDTRGMSRDQMLMIHDCVHNRKSRKLFSHFSLPVIHSIS